MIIINISYLGHLVHEIIKVLLIATAIAAMVMSKYMISVILLLLLIIIWLEEIRDSLFLDEEIIENIDKENKPE